MLGVYASAAAILLASLVLGRALLHLLGRTDATWLAGAVGFAALTVAAPLLIRLPGRAATVAVLAGIALLASLYVLWRSRGSRPRTAPGVPLAVIAIVLAAASLPFVFNERDGPLGEGIYTNDQGAQLSWTDWLQHGVGPEPKAVQFGYPTGPQSVAAVAAEATNASLLEAFNGLLVAIPVLTALAALAALDWLPAGRRVVAASLAGLPYLAASFLAQSAFKETAMALLVLAFAVALGELGRPLPADDRQPHPRRAHGAGADPARGGQRLRLQPPGVGLVRDRPPDLARARGRHRAAAHRRRRAARRRAPPPRGDRSPWRSSWSWSAPSRPPSCRGSSARSATCRRRSAGSARRCSPARPSGSGRRAISGSSGATSACAYPAVALGLVAAALGALAAVRRRDWGLVAVGAAAVILYVGARLFASIYVDAKALAVMSPLVVVAALGALFAPRLPGGAARYAAGRNRRGRPGGLDLRSAAGRAGRLRPAWRGAGEPRRPGPGSVRSPSSASTASPDTGCAER